MFLYTNKNFVFVHKKQIAVFKICERCNNLQLRLTFEVAQTLNQGSIVQMSLQLVHDLFSIQN